MKKEKSFSRVCGNIHAIAIFFMALEAMAIVFTILSAAGVPQLELEYSGHLVELVPTLIWDTMMLIVFNFTRQIFGRLRKSDTPFLECVPRKFKAIAYALVIGGGTHFFSSLIIVGCLPLFYPSEEIDVAFSGSGVFMVMIGAVIWGLAYIFERGFALQQESDETI